MLARKKINNFIVYITTFLFLLSCGFVIGHHELWRDEVSAYLLSRDSANIVDLFKNVRYQGHNVLWYLCLRAAHYFYNSVYSMQILSVLISSISVFIFTKYSPFRLWQKLLFVFGFWQFYEYTVLSRDYCLQILLLFIFAALYSNKVKNYIYLSVVIILLAFTNAYALIAGGSLFCGLIYEYKSGLKKPSLNIRQLSTFICLTSLGIVGALFEMKLPLDTINYNEVINAWCFTYNAEYLSGLKDAFTLGFIALPISGPIYWDGSLMYSRFFHHLIFPFILLLQIYSLYLLRKNKTLLITYFIFIFSFILFSYSFFQGGSQRHFGILFIFWMLLLWMASYKNINYKANQSLLSNPIIFYSFSIFLILQFIGGINASVNDIKYDFSDSKNLANYLKNNGYLNDDYIISAFPDWAGLSSVAYLPEITKFYYYQGKNFYTYSVSDSRRTEDTTIENLACEAYDLSVKTNKKIVVISSRDFYEIDTDLRSFKPIYTSKGISTVGENYVALVIDKTSRNKISHCKKVIF